MNHSQTIHLFANSKFDYRRPYAISRLYRIFCVKYGYKLKIIDEEFLSSNKTTSNELSLLIIAGGDGTINRAINSIPDEQIDNYLFGLIQGGTANELTKSLNIPYSINKAAEIICNPKEITKFHVGCLNNKYKFVTGLLYGMADYVLRKTPQSAKHYLGGMAFLYGLVNLFYDMLHLKNNHEITLKINGEEITTNYILINNTNLKSKNINYVKEEINKFNLIYIQNNPNKLELIRLMLLNQMKQNILNNKYINYSQQDTFTIEYPNSFSFLLDGEQYEISDHINICHCNKSINIITA